MSSRNQGLSKEAYENALKASWDVAVDLEKIFPDHITQWINKKSIELGVPFMYIAYPLITGVAYTLGKSQVAVTETYVEPIIIYSLVSGRSGTNKSGSLSLIKKIIDNLPPLKNEKAQRTFDTGTLEGLLNALADSGGCLFSPVDEFTTFLDSLDKNNTGNAERARYLSLWSGADWSKRTKTKGSDSATNPRYNLTGFNQNYFLINMMINTNQYDGFLPRFLIATPPEIYITLQQKVDAAKQNDNINMNDIFLFLSENFFEHGFTFTLSDEAMELFKSYHDDEVLNFRKRDQFEDTKSMIKSKSIGNVLRVAAVECALRSTFHVQMNGVGEIEEIIKISRTDMEMAIRIVNYSVKCLFALIDSTNVHKRSSLKRFHEMPDVNNIDIQFLEKHKSKIQKIFSSAENNIIPISVVTKNHLYPQIGLKSSSEDAKTFLSALELYGIGKFSENEKKKSFILTQKENVTSPEKINIFKRLGLITGFQNC